MGVVLLCLREIRPPRDPPPTAKPSAASADVGDPLWLAQQGRWEEYYAEQTRKFLQAQWSRMTLKIIRRWENEIHCMASNTKHKIKWTRILAERRLLKAGG